MAVAKTVGKYRFGAQRAVASHGRSHGKYAWDPMVRIPGIPGRASRPMGLKYPGPGPPPLGPWWAPRPTGLKVACLPGGPTLLGALFYH